MMRLGMALCLSIGGLLVLAGGPARAEPFGELLVRTDAVRTSDTSAFFAHLERLEARESEADDRQRQHLRLLRNHAAFLRGDYGQALGESVALFDQIEDPDLKYRAGLQVANLAAATRDFLLGLRYLERALLLQPRVRDPEVRPQGASVAATLYNRYGQYALGEYHARALLRVDPGPRLHCYGRKLLLEALDGKGALVGDEELDAAMQECLAAKEPIAVNMLRAILAKRWARAGKHSQAVGLLEASLPEAESTGYAYLIGEFHGLLAKFHLELGDLTKASAHSAKVQALAGQDSNWMPRVLAHEVAYRVALQRGDLATALHQYRLYADAERARLDDIKAREYAFQLSRHELNQKNQSIELLSNQNQVLRLRQEVAERSAWNFRLAIALLLVLAASAAYWGWRARRMHRSLSQLANTDGLTGLSNRRHFRARSEAALAQCEQRHRPVCMLLFDLDHFKQINDQCGHSSGDWVLREVARVGRKHCREGDLFGRIGGEEYAMTLVDCDVEDAMRIADQCRASIEAIDAGAAGCELPVAASVGVVGTSMSGYEYETLIAHADAAMYRSKVAGRNRVSLYQPPPVPGPGREVRLDGRNAQAMLKEY